MHIKGYKRSTTEPLMTNLTQIQVKLQKRDLAKVVLAVLAAEILWRAPISQKSAEWLGRKGDRLVEKIDTTLGEKDADPRRDPDDRN